MAVVKVFSGFLSPGQAQSWWATLQYPNNSPDLFLSWLLRPVHQSGHATHSDHKVEMTRMQVERTPGGPVYLFDIRSTGTHPTDFEMLANYTSI